MQKKPLAIILIIAIITTATALIMHRLNKKNWKYNTEKIWKDFQANDVTSFTITDSNGQIIIHKQTTGWYIKNRYNYPIDFNKITTFLRTIEAMKPVETVRISKRQYSRLQLQDPTKNPKSQAIKIEFTLNNNNKKIIYLGKLDYVQQKQLPQQPIKKIATGRFIRFPNKKIVCKMDKIFQNIDSQTKHWIHNIIGFGKIQAITSRENNKTIWKLIPIPQAKNLIPTIKYKNARLNIPQIITIQRCLTWLSITDIADPTLPNTITGLNNPHQFILEEQSGIIYTLSFGNHTKNGVYLTIKLTITPKQAKNPKLKKFIKEQSIDKQIYIADQGYEKLKYFPKQGFFIFDQ